MSTLSLDLRGVEATHALRSEAPAKGASVSLLLHTVGISTLVFLPLLQSTNPPEVLRAIATPLFRPITVTLPPAPRPVRPAPSRSRDTRSAHTAAVTPTTPTQAPDALSRNNVLDVGVEPGRLTEIGDFDPGRTDAAPGDCPLGSLCGPGLEAIADPGPVLVHIGGLVKEPRLIEGRAPQYPPIAQAAGVGGKVVLEARVGQDGRVREVRIREGHTLFDEAALASVRSRRYEPLLLNGVPTEFLITITVAFNVRR